VLARPMRTARQSPFVGHSVNTAMAASVPWHPAHGALATSPSKIRPPSATASGVDPGGVGKAACAPASGWMPSGGTAEPAARLSVRDDGVGDAATLAVAGP
jgi:hypothetical protein